MSDYTTRPISDHGWLRPDHERAFSQFSASWSDTRELLIREVFPLQTRNMPDPVIEVDVRERDIRIDGGLRADAKAASPAVVVAFESKHGPLIYRCDRYRRGQYRSRMEPWQHNVRAIALTLESLRAVDRYGATSSGEQYRGFKALPAGTGAIATAMTVGQAFELLRSMYPNPEHAESVTTAHLLRRAKAMAHPDRNDGDRALWDQVELAERVLQRAGVAS